MYIFQSSLLIKVNLDPWLSPITPNEYEQVETIPKEQGILINNITRVKSRSVDDLSRTSNDQSSCMKYNTHFFLLS